MSAVRRRGTPSRFWLRDALKRHLSPTWARRLRKASRLRWITKARLLRTHHDHWRGQWGLALGYLLTDPEVESFTYEISNQEELLDFASSVLGCPRAEVAAYAAEAAADPDLAAPGGGLWLRKRHLPLANRLLWYVAVRVLKPTVTVETGIHDGLGSLVLLRALERNAEEGHEGRLISFDMHADTGWLVRPHLHRRWRRVHGSTTTELDPALAGLRVDLSFHDTPAEEALQRAEFEAVLRHRAERTVIVNSSGARLAVLREVCEREGVAEHAFTSKSSRHIHPGNAIALATFSSPAVAAER